SGTITVSSAGTQKTINSEGVLANVYRTVETVIAQNISGAGFFYGIQVGDGGLDMGNSSTVNGNVYSNGNITGGNNAWITGTAAVAGGINASPSVSWTTQNADENFATLAGNRDIAQSFTANVTDRVNKVSVFL